MSKFLLRTTDLKFVSFVIYIFFLIGSACSLSGSHHVGAPIWVCAFKVKQEQNKQNFHIDRTIFVARGYIMSYVSILDNFLNAVEIK